MSERERRSKSVFIEFNDMNFECTINNTSVYLHEGAHKVFDHIFVQCETDDNEEESGVAFFRETLTDFDKLVTLMTERDFAVIEKEQVSNLDKEIYKGYFGKLPDICTPTVKTYELTPRHERLIQQFGATMLTMPDDLLFDELTGPQNRPYPELWCDN